MHLVPVPSHERYCFHLSAGRCSSVLLPGRSSLATVHPKALSQPPVRDLLLPADGRAGGEEVRLLPTHTSEGQGPARGVLHHLSPRLLLSLLLHPGPSGGGQGSIFCARLRIPSHRHFTPAAPSRALRVNQVHDLPVERGDDGSDQLVPAARLG